MCSIHGAETVVAVFQRRELAAVREALSLNLSTSSGFHFLVVTCFFQENLSRAQPVYSFLALQMTKRFPRDGLFMPYSDRKHNFFTELKEQGINCMSHCGHSNTLADIGPFSFYILHILASKRNEKRQIWPA